MGKITCYDAYGNQLNCLHQWDSNRVVVISGVEPNIINEVHFCNLDSDAALVVKPRVIDGEVVANVPNVLLQQTKPILIYAFSSSDNAENRTVESARIVVVARPRPANYVYSESEVFSYAAIDRRLLALEESFSGVVKSVNGLTPDEDGNVELSNLPSGDFDLSGYATEQWVQDGYQQKGNYLTEVPDGYARNEDIPTKPEDIGAQPAGDYILRSELPSSPVQSVNGQTGDVRLTASDVGARSDNWMPTAQEVGALPSTYTPPDQTAEQVGADPKGTATTVVSQHNTADDSHNDIRLELEAINKRLTAFFNSDDKTLDEMSEIVTYITNNKALIESISTSKVNVSDIIDNLTTNVSAKPLSAAQGVVLKELIDAVSNSLSGYALKSEVPSKVSQLANDSNFITASDAPVQSVNGHVGDVSLDAASVGARPDNWMPTAEEIGAQPKGDYALRSELPTVPTKVSQLQNDKGYLTEHQDISGKLDADKLPEAVNTALAQAKASGEFDGDTGAPGVTPHIGTNGNWYIGSADTGVKAQGKDGSDASVTATKITSALGYTPAKQSDVEQKANKQGLSLGVGGDGLVYLFVDGVAQGNGLDINAEAVAGDVVGYVDSDNTIILTGALADGTYTFKYADDEGKTVDIGNLSIGNVSNIKNWLRESYESVNSTAIYNVNGYKIGYRFRSNSEEQALSVTTATNPVFITGFIPLVSGQTVRLKNCYIDTNGINGSASSTETKNYYGEACSSINILLCNGQGTTQNVVSWANIVNSEYFTATPDSDGIVTEFVVNRSGMEYIRLALAGDAPNAIVTVDQPITD